MLMICFDADTNDTILNVQTHKMNMLSLKKFTMDSLYLHYDFKILDSFLLWFVYQTAWFFSLNYLVSSENSIWEHSA